MKSDTNPLNRLQNQRIEIKYVIVDATFRLWTAAAMMFSTLMPQGRLHDLDKLFNWRRRHTSTTYVRQLRLQEDEVLQLYGGRSS